MEDIKRSYTSIRQKENGYIQNEKRIANKTCFYLKKHLLVVCLLISMITGILLGGLLRLVDPPLGFREQMYLRFPGEIFMNMLQMLILPLIVSSLITGITSLDSRVSGKLGGRAVIYYLTTTIMAVILGIILVCAIRPGEHGGKPKASKINLKKLEVADAFLDLIRQMFPNNIMEAAFTKRLTSLEKVELEVEENSTDVKTNHTLSGNTTQEPELIPVLKYVHGINMMGLVVFSLCLGMAINRLGPKGRPLKELIESLCEATMVIITAVIWFSPVGVLFLIAAQVVKMDDPTVMFAQLGMYFMTVMVGLFFHGLVALPLLYFVLCRKNPYKFMQGMIQAMITAFGAASSSAALPVTMKNLEENNGVDPRVTAFVAPVGATINMDGTALYEAVAVIFIGQVNGFDLDFGRIITIALTATAASIGAATVPQSGLVTMVMVLTSVGFPVDGIGMILAVDWLLDRFRTTLNVLGDSFGAAIVDHFSRKDLEMMTLEDLNDSDQRENNMELASIVRPEGE